jgi:UDP-N-acetylmuramoyl-tripeptide--D-alanyl-D-alanine ligase
MGGMQLPQARFASLLAFVSLYSPLYPFVLVNAAQTAGYDNWAYLKWYWQTTNFRPSLPQMPAQQNAIFRIILILLTLGMLGELGIGLLFLAMGLRNGATAVWEFGAALIVAYPVVWANILAFVLMLTNLLNLKQMGKVFLCLVLESQVRKLRSKYQFTIIAVAGSVGKTSLKLTIARLCETQKKVMFQNGNYNDRLTVPLAIFGQKQPSSLYNLLSWAKIIRENGQIIKRGYSYDIAVVELGSDHPGDIAQFQYLQPEIGIVTAVAPEHMEYFETMAAVAKEELTIARFAKRLLVNTDDIAADFMADLPDHTTYGLSKENVYHVTRHQKHGLKGEDVTCTLSHKTYHVKIPYLGDQGVKTILGALAVVDILKLDIEKIITVVPQLPQRPGRMQLLTGKQGATLIDDTYNASPLAVQAALDVLYEIDAPQRIAVLGNMNELGNTSQVAHREIGAYCDPTKLAAVVTIGQDANAYLASAARERGCVVYESSSPYDAGDWVLEHMQAGAIVLLKGSQNGVFAEEALKVLLANPDDESMLVRQSSHWSAIKRRQFKK